MPFGVCVLVTGTDALLNASPKRRTRLFVSFSSRKRIPSVSLDHAERDPQNAAACVSLLQTTMSKSVRNELAPQRAELIARARRIEARHVRAEISFPIPAEGAVSMRALSLSQRPFRAKFT